MRQLGSGPAASAGSTTGPRSGRLETSCPAAKPASPPLTSAEHHQPPRPVHHHRPASPRQGTDEAVRAASLARPPLTAVHAVLREDQPNHAHPGLRRRRVLLAQHAHHRRPCDRDAVASGAAAAGVPWQHYDLGHGGCCTYTFFEQRPHRMACARCDSHTPRPPPRLNSSKPEPTCRRGAPPSAHRGRAGCRRRRPSRPRPPPGTTHRRPHPIRVDATSARHPGDCRLPADRGRQAGQGDLDAG